MTPFVCEVMYCALREVLPVLTTWEIGIWTLTVVFPPPDVLMALFPDDPEGSTEAVLLLPPPLQAVAANTTAANTGICSLWKLFSPPTLRSHPTSASAGQKSKPALRERLTKA